MLKILSDFERRPDFLEKFDAVVKSYSASSIFDLLAEFGRI